MTLNKFSIVKKCGSGALSDVFLALDADGQKVAIKSLKVFFKEESLIKERISKEAQILKELRDEKIVKYKDFFFNDQGTPSLVVEFVDGKDLSYFLQNLNSPKIPFIGAQIISEILLGLEEVHRFGFIHRDLKPENIMITWEGKIKITDFGLARNLESHDLTLSGTILGSPVFMSPEQCQGNTVDQRSDIFSLGVLLYYFATMTYPFQGESYPMIAKAITQTHPVPPMQLNPFVDESLNRIIKKALSKNPDERYQKVYEMRNDLMFFLDEYKIGHHSKVFKEFVEKNLSEEKACEQKLINKYTSLVNSGGNKAKSQFYLNQLIKINPHSESVLKLSANMNKNIGPNHLIKKGPLLVGLLTCVLMIFLFNQKEKGTEVTILVHAAKSQPRESIVIKTPVHPPLVYSPAKINKKTAGDLPAKSKIEVSAPMVKKNATEASPIKNENITGIQFTIPADTKVFVDDVEVNPSEIYRVNPGKHRLKMIKNNFTPIESEVDVINDRVTKINVGG